MIKKLSFLEHRKKFGTIHACLRYLLRVRGPENGLCLNPWCKAQISKYYYPLRGKPAFICRRCLGHFYPMVDSIFSRSHIPINIQFEIIFLMLSTRNSSAAKEIERQYAIGYPYVHRMMHEIRFLMGLNMNEPFRDTVVEIDESFIKTGNKGFTRNFQSPKGRSPIKNSNILVISERVGRAKLFVIPASDEKTIFEIINKHVDKSSLIITDEWKAYLSLKSKGYQHLLVNHSENGPNRYKNKMASTNNAEACFSTIKRNIKGTFRKVTDPYLPLYLNEFVFKHNHRNETDYGFDILFQALRPLSAHYNDKFIQEDYPKSA